MPSFCRMALEEKREPKKALWRRFEIVNRNEKKKGPSYQNPEKGAVDVGQGCLARVVACSGEIQPTRHILARTVLRIFIPQPLSSCFLLCPIRLEVSSIGCTQL